MPVMRTLNFQAGKSEEPEDVNTEGRNESEGSGMENFTFVICANAALPKPRTARTAMPQRK